jgi:hypothetical protein
MSGFKPWFIACVRSQFDLSANLTIPAIARVSSNRKTAKLKNKPVKDFRPTSADDDARILVFREKDWTASLTLEGCPIGQLFVGGNSSDTDPTGSDVRPLVAFEVALTYSPC